MSDLLTPVAIIKQELLSRSTPFTMSDILEALKNKNITNEDLISHCLDDLMDVGLIDFYDIYGKVTKYYSVFNVKDMKREMHIIEPLKLSEVKALSVRDTVRIIDYANDTTQPPHKTNRVYLILGKGDEELFVQSTGYSWFKYAEYGERWFAFAVDEE